MLVSPLRTLGGRSCRIFVLMWCVVVVATSRVMGTRIVTTVIRMMSFWKLLHYFWLQPDVHRSSPRSGYGVDILISRYFLLTFFEVKESCHSIIAPS